MYVLTRYLLFAPRWNVLDLTAVKFLSGIVRLLQLPHQASLMDIRRADVESPLQCFDDSGPRGGFARQY